MFRQFSMLVTLLVSAACGAGEEPKRCQRFGFSGKVEAGQDFRKTIGDKLVFSLRSTSDAGGGWTFEIGAPGDDNPLYIYDLDPPWRGRHITYLNTSYEMPARDAVRKGASDFWFALDQRGDAAAGAAVRQLIFSDSTQPEEVSFAKLDSVRKGRGVFRIVDSSVVPGIITEFGVPIPPQYLQNGNPSDKDVESLYGKILRVSFKVELTVPADFKVPSAFRSKSAACPISWMKTEFPHASK